MDVHVHFQVHGGIIAHRWQYLYKTVDQVTATLYGGCMYLHNVTQSPRGQHYK